MPFQCAHIPAIAHIKFYWPDEPGYEDVREAHNQLRQEVSERHALIASASLERAMSDPDDVSVVDTLLLRNP